MSKRVYEIAKELGVTSRDVIASLAGLGVVAKSHASTVPDDIAGKLVDMKEKGSLGKASPPAKAQRPARRTAQRAKAERPPAERPASAQTARPQREQPRQAPAHTRAPATSATQTRDPQAPVETAEPAPEAPAKILRVHRGITVQEMAARIGVPPAEIVKKLFLMGEMVTVTQSLGDDAVELIANDYGHKPEILSPEEEEELEALAQEEQDDPGDLAARPPVITVMGHVDHGKTLLLDRVRQTDVVSGEAGGITQHIGAYQVHRNDRAITFIDTPGHEAFTQMRARGAKVTDIAVLVVAADDGVKPQTVEAIAHARAAGVPIVVAVNKIDKPEADPTRVRQQLAEHGIMPPDWGGENEFVDVSAKDGTRIDDLLETLLLVADVQEIKANPKARARGVAVEAHLDKGRGPVATVLVQRGTLRVGEAIVCGSAWAKVRAMLDEHGRNLKEAPPGTPAQVLGFSTVPEAGDEFRVVDDEREARQIAQDRLARQRAAELVARKRVTLEDLFEQVREGEVTELNVILKADVQGSLEAIDDALAKVQAGEVRVRVLHKAAGAITENDVTLAQASGAIIVGFNVRPDPKARQLAEREKVDVRTYQIIYKLVEDIESALKGMMAPEMVEDVTGRAQVRATFKVPKIGLIAGCYVEEGTITRNDKVRLLRDGVIVSDTIVASLRRFKDDVREVAQGYECGVGLTDFQDVKEGDVLEFYRVREVPRA